MCASVIPSSYLYKSAWAAITKYRRLRGLNNRHLFLIVLEAEKSKIKVLADLVPGEGSLPGLYSATFSLCPHKSQRAALVSPPLLIRTLIPSWGPHPHDFI